MVTFRSQAISGWMLVGVLMLVGTNRASAEFRPSKLSADNLLLIVNKNEPNGQKLAAFYAQLRKVPEGRILSLDLPKGDEIGSPQFHADVIPAVREFLKSNQLDEKVTCLVTFYGVPLRVAQRVNTPEQSAEYKVVDEELKVTTAAALEAVASTEAVACEARPEFKPISNSQELPAIAARADAAIRTAIDALPREADADRRGQLFSRLMAAVEKLYGPLEAQERLATPAYQKLAAKPVSDEEQARRRAETQKVVAEVQAIGPKSLNDVGARKKLRELFVAHLGQIRSLQVQAEHKFRLETRETNAAFDSELACLWWPENMLRFRWHENPLHYRIQFAPNAATRQANPATRLPRTLMVARLDAPTEQIVHEMIETSIKVEAGGLKGIAAFDARGKPAADPYGKFDEKLREVSAELKTRSRVEVTLDDHDAVFPPGSVHDVAVYCGWYSLRSYVPGMTFVPGAVAYHVASGEMISLHAAGEKGWCANLLKAGVVATLGPVAEPYLHSFPLPTEFFPLLMTGKLKLAEVYWLSNPLISWMNTLVGDPLYNPYAAAPAFKDTDVSPQLRVIFAEPSATGVAP